MKKKDIRDEKNNDLSNREELESGDFSMEGLLQEQTSFSEKLYDREVVTVNVVHVSNEHVLVDIGEKKEGIIPISDFQGEKSLPEVGSKVTAVIEKRGGEDRHALLSHRKAQETVAWDECRKAFDEKTRVRGTVSGIIKGGYKVDLGGVDAFMPLSHSELRGAYKHHLPVKAKVKCYIVEISRDKKRLIVSRKQVLEEEEKVRRDKILGEIRSGDVVRVVVANVSPSGVSLRFHGLEGFARLADVAWKDPDAAIKTYKRGQRTKAKILSINKETGRLDFGIKQLSQNPADVLRRRFPSKAVLKAKVLSSDASGMKVSVAPDVEGFIPAFELGSDGPARAGEIVSVVATGVNPSTFNLNLSVKRYEEIQDRKKVQQYLKGAPPLTLGQLLSADSEDDGASPDSGKF